MQKTRPILQSITGIISTLRHYKRRSCEDLYQKRFLVGFCDGVIGMGKVENGKRKNIRTLHISGKKQKPKNIYISYTLFTYRGDGENASKACQKCGYIECYRKN